APSGAGPRTRPAPDGPTPGLAVRSGQDVITPGRLAASRWLSPSVLAVVIRAYSIANLPAEAARDGLEFHVRIYPDGAMSAWLAGAPPGSPLGIGVPAGDCFYPPGAP